MSKPFCLTEDGDEAFTDRPEEKFDDDDDEVERFADIDKMEAATTSALESKPVASWIHHRNLRGPPHAHTRHFSCRGAPLN